MSRELDPPAHDRTDGLEHLDEIGRRAGAELRRPAPPGGVALVERSVRLRRTVATAGAGLAVAALVAGGIALAMRDRENVATDDPAPTTAVPSPTVVTETTVVPDTTVVSDTSVPPETTPPPTTTTPAEPAVSDQFLPDPLRIAADGFERVLVGRDLIVRSDPEQVIALDLPEPELWLYGVGPNGVAYLRADGDGLSRILAVPTVGPTAGVVHELVPPYAHEGPWLGFMTPRGIDPFSTAEGPGIVPYVDNDGRPLADPVDPTFTWRVEYRLLDDGSAGVQPVVVDPGGAEHALPITESGREGQFDAALRPLPDGRVTLLVLPEDGIPKVWAFDPARESWTIHPFE